MLRHMADRAEVDPRSDMKVHHRDKSRSILHASINGQHFDVANWIIKRMVEEQGEISSFTCLQLLARMPRVFPSYSFKSMGPLDRLIYYLLPKEKDNEGSDVRPAEDLETGQQHDAKSPTSVLSRINYAVWTNLAKVFKKKINSLWKEKQKHQHVEAVAKFLVVNDYSWQDSLTREEKPAVALPSLLQNVPILKQRKDRKKKKKLDEESHKDIDMTEVEKEYNKYTPLLVAASNGIIEIVMWLLEEHPESINHIKADEENILHVALRHRQLKIFEFLMDKYKPYIKVLVSRISKRQRTVLHQVARMEFYRGSSLAGAAFQLQEELNWYKRMEDEVPVHLFFQCDEEHLTAGDVLDIDHDLMLKDAQEWTTQTAQSCSTVAVLVATVVFAAAYTIPGGNDHGLPVLLNSPLFIFFTVMDVVALAFSLASVVMFLSILTSPFELWDFHVSIPNKLNIGFAFLFCSLITTMLAFSATILLTIRLQWKNWTSTLVYGAAFFPVSIFGLIQFPLYKKIPRMLLKMYDKIIKPFQQQQEEEEEED